MSKQDKTYSRTPEDLERKYNLGHLVQGSNSQNIKIWINETDDTVHFHILDEKGKVIKTIVK